MIGLAFLQTALLLGLYVLLAGSYGLLYAVARVKGNARIEHAAPTVYGLHTLSALSVIAWTPLLFGWKALIVATSLVFLAIPPVTWRYLQRSHGTDRSTHDRKRPQRPARVVARL